MRSNINLKSLHLSLVLAFFLSVLNFEAMAQCATLDTSKGEGATAGFEICYETDGTATVTMYLNETGTDADGYTIFDVTNNSFVFTPIGNVTVDHVSGSSIYYFRNVPRYHFGNTTPSSYIIIKSSCPSFGGLGFSVDPDDRLRLDTPTITDNVNCEAPFNGAIALSVLGNTSGQTVSWTGPNGFTSTDQDITALKHGTYTVVVTNGNACSVTADYVVNDASVVPDAPTGDSKNICQGDAIPTLTAAGDAGNVIRWYDDASRTNLLHTGASYLPGVDNSIITTHTYYVDQTNETTRCVSNLAPISLSINIEPTITLVTGPYVGCDNYDLQTAIDDFEGSNTYTYYDGDPDAGGTAIASTVTTDGTYWIKAENGSCEVTKSLTVAIDETPTADAGDPGQICQLDVSGGSFAFTTANMTGAGATAVWSTTDGAGTFNAYDNTNPASAVYNFDVADALKSSLTFTLTVSSPNGACTPVTSNVTVQINETPVVDAGSDDTICSSESATLSATFSGGATGVTWTTNGTGSFADATAANTTYTPSSDDILNGSVVLTATTNANGSCGSVSDDLTLSIEAAPIADAGIDQTICEGSDVTVTGTISGGATSATWTTSGTGTFADASLPSTTYTPSAADISAGTVDLILTTNAGTECVADVDQLTVTIDALPVVDAGSDDTICSSESATLSATFSGGATGITWTTNGTGSFADATAANTTYTPSLDDISNGSVVLTATTNANGSCGSVSDDLILSIEAAPIADAGTDQTICEGSDVTVTGTISGGATSATWTTSGTGTFADASLLSTTYTPSAADISAGTVDLILTTNAGTECVADVDQLTVTIDALPVVDAGSDDTICSSESATLSATLSGGATGVTWTTSGTGAFADATAANTTYTPSLDDVSNGSVVLTATTNANGSCGSVSDDLTLSIEAAPIADAGVDQTICGGSDVTVTGTISGGATSATWTTSGTGTFADASLLSTTYTPSADDISAGTVDLILTTNAGTECVADVDQLTVTIDALPVVNAGLDATICSTDQATLSATFSGGATGITWTTSGTGSFADATAANTTYTPSLDDISNGSVVLTATTNANGSCGSVSDDLTLSIEAAPIADAGTDQTICAGIDVTVTGIISGGATSATWTTSGSGTFADATSLSTTYTPSAADISAGTVDLILTTNAGTECVADVDQLTVTIDALPVVDAGSDATICSSESATLSATFSGGATVITWTTSGTGSFADATAANTTYTPSSGDISNGSVVLTATTNANGTCGSVSDDLTLSIEAAPIADAGTDQTICAGSDVTVTGTISGGATSASWTTSGTGTFADASLLSTTYTPSAADISAGTVNLILTTNAGTECVADVDQLTVTIDALPVVDAGSDATICSTDQATLSATFSGGATGITWTTSGTGSFADATAANTTYTPSSDDISNGSVVLTATTNANGTCGSVSDDLTLSIEEAPIADAGIDQTICEGSDVTVTGSISGGATSATWTTSGSGTFADASLLSTTYTPSAADISAGTVDLILTTNAGTECVADVDQLTVTIDALPVVSAGLDAMICSSESATLSATFSGGATGITWTTNGTGSFADATAANTTYTPSLDDISNGSVVLTATTNANGTCGSVSDDLTLTIEPATTVSNAGADATSCELTYTLSANVVAAGEEGTWSIVSGGAGTFADATDPSTTFTADAVNDYVLKWTISKTAGVCPPSEDEVSISFNDESEVALNGDDTICEGTSADLNVSISNAVGTYTVVINDGTSDQTITGYSAGDAISVTPTATTTYILVSVTSETNTCVATIVDNEAIIDVESAPIVDAGADQQICSGDIINLTGSITGDYDTFTWTTEAGDGTFTDDNTLTPTYQAGLNDITTGEVKFYLTAEKAGSSCGVVTGSITVVINTLDFAVEATALSCDAYDLQDAITNVSPTAAITYYDGDPASGGSNIGQNISASGTYWIEAELGSCIAALPVAVTINPTVNATLNIVEIANTDDKVTFSVTTDGVSDLHSSSLSLTWDASIFANPIVDDYNQVISPAVDPAAIIREAGGLSFNWNSDGVNGQTLASGEQFFTISLDRISCGGDGNIAFSDMPVQIKMVTGQASCEAVVTNNPFDFGIIAPVQATITTQNVSSCTMPDGRIEVAANGGVSPYTYSWKKDGVDEPTETAAIRENLSAGQYEVTITDTKGCTYVEVIDLADDSNPPLASASATDNMTCGTPDGTITLTVSGGTEPYTFLWSDGNTDKDRTGLIAGNYSVTVTDAVGCEAVTSAKVGDQSGAPSVSAAIENDSNCAAPNGSLTLTITDGTGPFTFLWDDNGSTDQDRVELVAGTYTVTVTDANNCASNTTFVVIDEKVLPRIAGSVTGQTNCVDADGAIQITVSDGEAPFTYLWSNGETTQNIENLSAGTYTVTVTDTKGCSGMESFDVEDNTDAPMVSVQSRSAQTNCVTPDGSITLDAVTGGTAPYTFTWSDGTTGETFVDKVAGTYSVIVTDANGCSTTLDDIEIEDNTNAPVVTASITHQTLCGSNTNGAISLNITGGVAPLTYEWNTGDASDELQNIAAGTYSVTVTDANSCTGFVEVEVLDNTDSPNLSVATTDQSNCETPDGAISITVADGTTPYTIEWDHDNSLTDFDLSNLSEGTYTGTVTDALECSASFSATITNTADVPQINPTITNQSDCVNPDGEIAIEITGGEEPYNVEWLDDDTAPQNRTELTAGTYTIKVVDAKMCETMLEVTVGDDTESPVLAAIIINHSDCVNPNGSISLTVAGGTEPYTYAWSNGETTSSIANLENGDYTVTVTSDNSCSVEQTFTVGDDRDMPVITIDKVVDKTDCDTQNGEIHLSVTGGDGAYTFKWEDDATINSAIRTGLRNGTYRVSVQDGESCETEIVEIKVGQPEDCFDCERDFRTAVSTNAEKCNGSKDGAIVIQVDGAPEGSEYFYEINGDRQIFNTRFVEVTSINREGIGAGTYQVSLGVVDDLSCGEIIKTANVSTALALNTSFDVTNPTCEMADGQIKVILTPTVGSELFELYDVNENLLQTAVDGIFRSLAEGTYFVKVKQADCESELLRVSLTEDCSIPPVDCEELAVTETITHPSCDDPESGMVILTPSQAGDFRFELINTENTIENTDGRFDGLEAGDYSFIVSAEVSGCSVSGTLKLNASNDINITWNATESSCNNNDGSIQLQVSGGQAPYAYRLNGQDYSLPEGGLIDNLGRGTYTFEVTDNKGCVARREIEVTSPDLVYYHPVTVNQPSCEGNGKDGSFTVRVNREQTIDPGPYFISINGGAFEEMFGGIMTYDSLTNGNYNVVLKAGSADSGCPNELVVAVEGGVDPISFKVNESDQGCIDESAIVEVTDIYGTAGVESTIELIRFEGSSQTVIAEVTADFTDFNTFTFDADVVPGKYQVRVWQAVKECEVESRSGTFEIIGPGQAMSIEGIEVLRKSFEDRGTGIVGVKNFFRSGMNGYEVRIHQLQSFVPGLEIDERPWVAIPNIRDVEVVHEYVFKDLSAGLYQVEFRDRNGEGCLIISDEFELEADPAVWIPNLFTPNGDSKNETFYIRNMPKDEDEGGWKIIITNRWGGIVYRNDDYRKENAWDGRGVPDGTYFYSLDAGETGKFNGWIEVFKGRIASN
ncbi:gliding motility-associated C-terminal domain-containing protein [Persicobacter psychrovividus]|uniref:Ig-like domain-containing protein n=1 Tax=Persicobacter psychrovividus TaxID=387638 RepID=A0ABM7VCH6_9BACT|nr:hypothetical protein PEPS_07240 [Persicobacter psychrovividus]